MRNFKSIAVLVVVSLLALVSGCFHARDTSAPATHAPDTLRVITYNIHHGEGTDGKLDLARIARIITENHADLAAIQEVDVRTKRVPQDTPAELERLTGMHATFGKAIDYQGGDYWQLILSRFPVSDARTIALPGKRGRERRIAVAVTVAPGHGHPSFQFVSTHLDHQIENERVAQAKALVDELRVSAGIPTILCGDFNATPERTTMKTVYTHFDETAPADQLAPTIPSGRPTQKIDYVLTSKNSPWKVVDSRVLDEPIASDHRPVFTQFSW